MVYVQIVAVAFFGNSREPAADEEGDGWTHDGGSSPRHRHLPKKERRSPNPRIESFLSFSPNPPSRKFHPSAQANPRNIVLAVHSLSSSSDNDELIHYLVDLPCSTIPHNRTMHDAGHDALPLSLDGADSTVNNRVLVVATITAILLAGSAMVYRARPSLLSPVSNMAATEGVSGASSQDRDLDPKSKRKAAGLSVKSNTAGEGVVDAQDTDPTPPSLSTKPALDLEASKDSKSSRSKDRRRRGKDPLKEILKGGKKAKLFTSSLTAPSKGTSSTPTSQYDYNNDPENDKQGGGGGDDADDDGPDFEQHASPASSSASLLPDSATHSLSRAKGKRAQRNASIDLSGTTHFSSAGSTSASHSRAASNSEVSQRQSQRLDGPSSDHFHPLQNAAPAHHHPHDRPPSSSLSASEENDGRPNSRMSSYSSSSLSHPHTNTHQPTVPKDIDAGLGSHLRTPRLDEGAQARRVDLAPGNESRVEHDSQEREGEGHSGKSVWARDSSTSPPSTVTTTTTTTIAGLVDADGFSKPKSKSKSKASTSSASSSVSMDTTTTDLTTTTTTTGTTSMTSSLVMTRATSPSPSDASKKTPVAATTNDNDTPTPPLMTGAKPKSPRKAQSATTSSPKKGDKKPQSPWSWDGAGDVDASSSSALDAAATNIIASVTGAERNSKDKESKGKDSDSYKKPPRLQGTKGGGAATFSAVAASGTLTATASQPLSVYSPTNASFSGLGGSVSFSAASPLSSSSHAGGGESEVVMEEEASVGEREEEEAFTFPTLNPTTTTSGSAGSSRTRSSLADINNSNNFNNNTPQINNPRRARPPTPSRSNLSSASHTPPPTSSSPSSQPGSISSSSGVNGNNGSVANPNANGGGVLLSTQTQLASLRGALEAARLREEKHKTEMERVVKEVDVLRWEHANSRRGEIELQTHVRQLMQQLQAYASLFASMAPQLNAHYQQYYLQQQQQLQQQAQQQQQQLANGSSAGGVTPGAVVATAESGNSDALDVSATPSDRDAESCSASSSSVMSTTTAQEPTSTLQGLNQTPTQPPSNPPPPPLHIPTTFPASFQMNGGVNGVHSPVGGVVSPSLGISYPGSPPFFPYTMSPHPHAPPTPHTHPLLFAQQLQLMQQQQQYQQQINATQAAQAQASPHQANLFSMHFPQGPQPPAMMSPHQHHQVYATHGVGSGAFGMGSGPSSVAGTSSAGSMSPDLGGSPSPGGAAAVNGGKRRTRTRTQTVNGRMNARGAGVGVGPTVGVWEERTLGDPWVGVEESVIEEEPEKESGVDGLLDGSLRRVNGHVSVGDGEEDEEGFSEGGFNELLADAILKRPGSIRVRSFSKKEKAVEVESEKGRSSPTENANDATVVMEEVEQLTEFKFPSLSDLGNVHYRSESRKVNGDCGVSTEEAGELSPVVPDAQEDDKASVGEESSVEPGVDVAPTESTPDLEITSSKEGIVPIPTESISPQRPRYQPRRRRTL
ncbi:hypothetical protein M413DRAFT_25931 [Hebeloma cylindrosporum]|uniref:Uncharacterized protein n=1 Tax=Hebeloma cylindrosporum TaxID=76867 RepID=A0A0C2Y1A4_HEBCY|nr:hypothetical protein M413DRAFT_25931 [Hebeloma cylindrosporum h7]